MVDFAAGYLIDLERGSWHHELDATNVPSDDVWPGKPDLYHAVQATLLPLLPLAPGLTVALRDRLAKPMTREGTETGTCSLP
jgi:sulfoquinovose isomerase